MAARRTTGAGAGAGRESRVRSRQGEDQAKQQAAQAAQGESGGMGMADALGIVTFVVLVVGFVLMDRYLGTNFNTGLFFTT